MDQSQTHCCQHKKRSWDTGSCKWCKWSCLKQLHLIGWMFSYSLFPPLRACISLVLLIPMTTTFRSKISARQITNKQRNNISLSSQTTVNNETPKWSVTNKALTLNSILSDKFYQTENLLQRKTIAKIIKSKSSDIILPKNYIFFVFSFNLFHGKAYWSS